jgi:hypothetical protein
MKSKTMWFSGVLAALGVVQTTLPTMMAVPPQYQGPILLIVSAVVAGLRVATKEAVL